MDEPQASLRVERRPLGAADGEPVAWIWMARPALHNAFDEGLIAALDDAFATLDADPSVRVIVLAGEGRSFSAGADLRWMQRQGEAAEVDNLDDARRLAALFRRIAECRKPTVARVQGAALGGGMGLACACDVCIASEDASFATTEVRLGLIPAVIGPYVLRAIGARQALRYFQSGERIPAARALELGIVLELVEREALDARLDEVLEALLAGGPLAQAAAKALVRDLAQRPLDPALLADTAARIARLRATPEAREGLEAFLAKRAPRWGGPA
jgi:methylglutaconyl-CoA hydratase